MSLICCPQCGKTLGEEHDKYYLIGSGRIKIWKPICPRAIEIPCPGILTNKEKCKKTFTLEEAKCG